MKTLSWRFWIYASLALGFLAIFVLAEAPGRLDFGGIEVAPPRRPIAVQALEETEPPPPPEEVSKVPDALQALAPAPMTSQAYVLDSGFGLAFGGSGGGPGIRGGGGLGGDVGSLVREKSQSDRLARVLSRASLEYPPEAKRRGVRGNVMVRIQVGTSGQPEEIRIVSSDPAGFFDEAVLRSLRLWRFEPAIVGGQIARSWVTQRIRFEVE